MNSWMLIGVLGLSQMAGASGLSGTNLKEIIAEYGISESAPIEVSSITYPFSACPPISQLYFVRIEFQGQSEGVDTTVRIAMETRSAENQERIMREIRQNYSNRGIPSCMQQDAYQKISSNPGTVLFEPVEVNSGIDCGYGEAYLPTSSCSYADPLYP